MGSLIRKNIIKIIYILIILLYISIPVRAGEVPYTLDAPDINFDAQHNRVYASGGIVFSAEEISIRAEELVIDISRETVQAKGEKVRLITPDQEIEGTMLEYDYDKGTGSMFGARSEIDQLNFRGKEIRLVKEKEYQALINEASFTPCILPEPHYQIRAEKLKIYSKERIVAEKVQFLWGDFCLFQLPSYVVNYEEDEESGKNKLSSSSPVPRIGYDSKMGIQGELTYPYLLSPQSEGKVYVDAAQRGDRSFQIKHSYQITNQLDWEGGYQLDRKIDTTEGEQTIIDKDNIYSQFNYKINDYLTLRNKYDYYYEEEDGKLTENKSNLNLGINYNQEGFLFDSTLGYDFNSAQRKEDFLTKYEFYSGYNILIDQNYTDEVLQKDRYKLSGRGDIVNWDITYQRGYDLDYRPYLKIDLPEIYNLSSGLGLGLVKEGDQLLDKGQLNLKYSSQFTLSDQFSLNVGEEFFYNYYQDQKGNENHYQGLKSSLKVAIQESINETLALDGSLEWKKVITRGNYWLDADQIEEKNLLIPELTINLTTPQPQSSLTIDSRGEYDIDDRDWNKFKLRLTRKLDCYSYGFNYEIIEGIFGVEINFF